MIWSIEIRETRQEVSLFDIRYNVGVFGMFICICLAWDVEVGGGT